MITVNKKNAIHIHASKSSVSPSVIEPCPQTSSRALVRKQSFWDISKHCYIKTNGRKLVVKSVPELPPFIDFQVTSASTREKATPMNNVRKKAHHILLSRKIPVDTTLQKE